MERVAIIGAGCSGLTSIKACIEEGLIPVCFEKSDHIGGLWYFSDEPRTNPNGPGQVYKELITNTSKEQSAFSDFPLAKSLPPFIKAKDMYEYYVSYAKTFDLLKYIRFNTEVVSVVEGDDHSDTGRWKVTARDSAGSKRTEVFDAVIVSTGIHSTGVVPDYPGLDEFEGDVLHSCQFRKGSDFEGKTVLVVGAGTSGGDLASFCCGHARKVYHSLRSGAWVLPRMLDGESYETQFTVRYRVDWVPAQKQADDLQSKLESTYDATELGIRSNRHLATVHPIVNETYIDNIRSGAINVKSGIRSFEGSNVNFTDGSVLSNINVVIFATGYDVKLPFLQKELIQDGYSELKLYMHMILPRLPRPTLVFVGFALPYGGGQNPVSEMQARYVTKLFKKEVQLPPVEEMEEEIQTRMNALNANFGNDYPVMVRPTTYKDTLAKAIGALPSLTRMFLTDPKLAYYYYFRPAYPACYRMVGPGAKPNAREAFLQSDVNHASTSPGKANGNAAGWFYSLPAVLFVGILSLTLYSYIS